MAETPHRFLNPDGLMPPHGFSHVAVPADGRLVFVAGQTALRADRSVEGDSLAEQFAAALRNLVTALEAADARPEQLVRMDIFVTDLAAYRHSLGALGDAWRATLGYHYPAISLFEVSGLADARAMVEIVSIAVVPE